MFLSVHWEGILLANNSDDGGWRGLHFFVVPVLRSSENADALPMNDIKASAADNNGAFDVVAIGTILPTLTQPSASRLSLLCNFHV